VKNSIKIHEELCDSEVSWAVPLNSVFRCYYCVCCDVLWPETAYMSFIVYDLRAEGV
jgi:hypothetical protein